MNNLVPFNSAKLPAYLQRLKRSGGLANFAANVNPGFPVLHIRGKEFSVTKDGTRTPLQVEDNDGELVPATYVDLVLLKANNNLSKVYYLKGYEDGSTAKPDCSSADGQKPDAGVPSPQSTNCASCPHNVFGTGANGKGKACSDARRLAVAAAGNLEEPMLLRVPPASLKGLADYARLLGEKGIPEMYCIITRLKFESGESTPKLMWTPRGFLSDDAFAIAEKTVNSELVNQIVGLSPLPNDDQEPAVKPGPATPEKVAQAVAQTAKPEPAKAPEPQEPEEAEAEEEQAPPTKRRGRPKAEKPEPAAPAGKKGSLDMDTLLTKIDGLNLDFDD